MKKNLLILPLLIALFFLGCGYKPSSHYVKEQISGNIFVDLYVDLKDPKNTVLIKDAMNEILVHRLNAKLVDNKKDADTIISLKLGSVSLIESSYDNEGYTKLYKAIVNIVVAYDNKKVKNSFSVSGTHDFSLDNSDTITDTKRFEAIKIAASKALEEVISKIAVNSFRK